MVVRRKKATPVILPRDRSNRQPWFRSPHLVPLVWIAAAVLVANGPSLLHLVTTNPLVLDAGLTPRAPGRLPGLPYVDGNAGFTMQALGHRAALDWLHGHVPWWNPYEGVGSPLAGEMQSGAFFPLTLVLAVPQGSLVLQLVVEAVTGWSTYFLVRRLGVGRTLATAAGVAFALCGTFAWLAHAPIRPVALLPLCLLGVERAIEAARERRPGGWRLLAVALALSVLAGFPETSLIDGVFVAWWAALRLAGPGRAVWRSSLARLAGGVVGGAALAAPLLVAFADYLPYGYVGAHNGAVAHASLPTVGLTQLLLPYSLGPVFGFHLPTGVPDTITGTWAYVGGFLSATLVAAALVGVVGRRLRSLRLGLAAWIAVCLLRTFGFQPVVHLLASVPGIRLTAFYRYADPSWELAVVVLAGLGLGRPGPEGHPSPGVGGRRLRDRGRRSLGGRDRMAAHDRGGRHASRPRRPPVPLPARQRGRGGAGPRPAGRRRRPGRGPGPGGPSDVPVGSAPPPGPDHHGRGRRGRVGPALRRHLVVGSSPDRAPDRFGGLAPAPPGSLPVPHSRTDPAQLRVLLRHRPGQRQRPARAQGVEHRDRHAPRPERPPRRLHRRRSDPSDRAHRRTGALRPPRPVRVGRRPVRRRERRRP